MTDLSPVAQAVIDAYRKRYTETLRRGPFVDYWQEFCAAEALRTAADQLINVQRSVEMWELHQKFHTIATELEDLPK
jgi:hypothetical protein